jgi:hypothetical protein
MVFADDDTEDEATSLQGDTRVSDTFEEASTLNLNHV